MKSKNLTQLKQRSSIILIALFFFSNFISLSSNAQINFRVLPWTSAVTQWEGMYYFDLDINQNGYRELMFYASDPDASTADWIGSSL